MPLRAEIDIERATLDHVVTFRQVAHGSSVGSAGPSLLVLEAASSYVETGLGVGMAAPSTWRFVLRRVGNPAKPIP